MNQDYEVCAYIAWNLDDACEELSQIIEMIRPDAEIDEAEFKSRLTHLYSHLNTAWNVRNESSDSINAASAEKLQAWKLFPKDINTL